MNRWLATGIAWLAGMVCAAGIIGIVYAAGIYIESIAEVLRWALIPVLGMALILGGVVGSAVARDLYFRLAGDRDDGEADE